MDHGEEKRKYEAERAARIKAIESTGVESMSLDSAARLLPEHPEWARYAPRRGLKKR